MRARGLPVVLLAFIGWVPVTAAARTDIRLAEAPPVALAEPRAATVLAAGEPAVLSWQPLDGFGELGELDEWEAFLSLDGGGTYPLRVTPQLDLDLRRVLWRVPNLASDDARLLLHLGGRAADGERFEIAVELPHTLRIAPPSSRRLVPPRWVLERGQAARPGEPGVVGWVEGSRRGEGLHEVFAVDRDADVAGYEPVEFGDAVVCIETDPPAHGFAAVLAGRAPPPRPPLARADSRRRCLPASRDILLQTSRLNE